MLKKSNFYNGWGDKIRYDKLEQNIIINKKRMNEIPIYPSIEWEPNDIGEMDHDRNLRKMGKFQSPSEEILLDGEKEHCFLLIESLFAHCVKRIVIIPQFGGDTGYGWRMRNLGKPLLKQGISVCLTTWPSYKMRENEKQKEYGIGWFDVIQHATHNVAFTSELRSLIRYFGDNYNEIVVATASMGGPCSIRAVFSKCFARGFPEKKYKLGFVGVIMQWNQCNRIVIEKTIDKKNKNLIEKKCPFPKIKFKSHKLSDNIGDVLDYFELLDFKNPIISDIDNVILVNASHDKIVTNERKKETEIIVKKVLNDNGKNVDECYKRIDFHGGHFTIFNKKGIDIYKNSILEMFKRLSKSTRSK